MIQIRERTGYGAMLRRERDVRNWSQQELVQQILTLCARNGEYPGLSTRTIGRWEREEHKPSPYYRKQLCQVFGRNAIQLGFMKSQEFVNIGGI